MIKRSFLVEKDVGLLFVFTDVWLLNLLIRLKEGVF